MKIRCLPLIGLACAMLWRTAAATDTLVLNGVPEAVIVTSDDRAGCISTAVNTLNEYIEKITGTELDVLLVNDNYSSSLSTFTTGRFAILVGESVFTDQLSLPLGSLKAEGFIIKSFSGGVAIVGHDEESFNIVYNYNTSSAGSLYGVYRFLEELGCRWFYPDPQYDIYPSESTLTIPSTMDITDAPYFENRFSYGNSEWRRKVGYGGTVDPWRTRHTFEGDRVEALFGDTHPDLVAQGFHFPIPGVMDLVIQHVRDYLSTPKHPGRNYIGVIPKDAYETAGNPYCEPFLTPERGPSGEYSDLIGWAAVQAAEAADDLPGKVVYPAYEKYRMPPLQITSLPDNLVVQLAQTRVYFNDSDEKEAGWDLIESWAPLDPSEFYFYRYYERFRKVTPSFVPHLIDEDIKKMKYFRENDILNIGGETNFGLVSADHPYAWWFCLNEYVTAKLLWNPDLDVDVLLADYYDKFFGVAAEPMEDFFTRLEELYFTPEELHLYSLPVIYELEGYLDEAVLLAQGTQWAGNVDYIDTGFDIVRAIRDRMEAESPLEGEDPVVYYTFDQGEGTVAEDLIGTADATIHDAAWTGGVIGNALKFDGEESVVNFPTINMEDTAYSYSLWVKPGEVTFGQTQYLIGSEAWDRQGLLLDGGTLKMIHRHAGSSWGGQRSDLSGKAEELKPGEWYHIVATYSPENGMALFINGVLVALEPSQTTPSEYSVRFIGAAGRSGASDIREHFKGDIDEVRIYKRELTFDEIQVLYFEPGVSAYKTDTINYDTPDADTYVTSGFGAASVNNGDGNSMWVRYHTNYKNRRSSYVRFDLDDGAPSGLPMLPVRFAELTFRMIGISSNREEGNTILVYGLNADFQGGGGVQGQDWGEMTMTGLDAPFTWTQGGGTDLSDLTLLGTFEIPPGDEEPPTGTEYTIRGETLVDFINDSLASGEPLADLITFILYEQDVTTGYHHSWATKEYGTIDPTSLTLYTDRDVPPIPVEYAQPAADSYVEASDPSGNNGTSTVMKTKRSGSGSTTRMSYVRFDLLGPRRSYVQDMVIEDSELTFRYHGMHSGRGQNTALVYALLPDYQGDTGVLGQDWDELELAANNAPWDPDTSSSSSAPAHFQLVGSFTTPDNAGAPPAGTEFTISSPELTAFLNNSLTYGDETGPLVTFVLTEENATGAQMLWASKEHATIEPTSLTVWLPEYAELYETGESSYAEGPIEYLSFGGPALDGFQRWLAAHYPNAQYQSASLVAPGAVPLNDTISNLMRAALGMSLRESAESLPVSSFSGAYPQLTYRQLRGGGGIVGVDYESGGITYRVEVRGLLDGPDWSWGDDVVEMVGSPVVVNDDIEIVTVRSRIAATEGNPVFMRLRILYDAS